MMHELKPYPVYKNSDVSWLGYVPDHWTLERARWLFRKKSHPVGLNDDVVTCFRDGTVTLRKNRRTTGFTESLQEIGYQGVHRGDLVIHAMDAFAGAAGVSDSDGKCTPVYLICESVGEANQYYYAYIVREMARSQWIVALAKGIRERSTDFRYDGFASQFLPFPPPAEQTAIVRYLEYMDRDIKKYIRVKQKLIKLLEEQKQAIIHQAVTRGLDRDVPMKPSGVEWLGDVPGHWDVKKIGYFARIGNGSTPSRSNLSYWADVGFPWLNSSCVHQDIVNSADQFVTDIALRECHLPIVPAGSVLIAITGQGKTRGTSTVLDMDSTINQHMAFIIPRKDVIIEDFLQLFLQAAYGELRRMSDDAGSTKGALTCHDVGNFKVALPSLEEQSLISNVMEKMTSELSLTIDSTRKEIELISEYRTRLIADVVTGKVDVREIAATLPDIEESDTNAQSVLKDVNNDVDITELTKENADAAK